ncbi:DUF4625 domain-containing protein [Carboxylicivirga mesophila]|uniref:DUF4625 domain-containing protein n=1 Tax=Carboxylicivirga mesophila TaxID=1166478 RepID=A0ABS5K5G7_9BACT|nr:DUF4625 domain-containing protein [Carboxylicivirga mesophila]MBS2210162.1 DUF4625 domain-containing protein [Carboxylicivirga mesophila]
MKLYIFYFYLICTLATCFLLMVSCSKDDPADTTAPMASFSSPVEATKYVRGQSLICNAVFEDNDELSHVDISISSLKSLKGYNDPWLASESVELTGKTSELSAYQVFGEAIPFEIMSGEYMLEFTVFDKALNYSTYKFNVTVE